jgi:hypothetical protein
VEVLRPSDAGLVTAWQGALRNDTLWAGAQFRTIHLRGSESKW